MGRAPRVERLLLYDWTSQAPQSALLSLDRVSGLAGLRATSDADSQDETGWSWGRKANGDEGAQLPNPGQRRQTASFVIPPPGGEGF